MQVKSILGVVAAVAAAGLILAGVLPQNWRGKQSSDTDYYGKTTTFTLRVGPTSGEVCEDSDCRGFAAGDLPKLMFMRGGDFSMWILAGRIAYYGGILASLALLAAAVLAFVRKVRLPKALSPGGAAGVLSLSVLMASVFYLVLFPAAEIEGQVVSLSFETWTGFYLTVAGSAFGIVGSGLLLFAGTAREIAEIAAGTSFVPPPPKAPERPKDKCPICDGPAEWKAGQNRWYCPACKSFV